jgi:hypothetical protein
MTKSRTGWAEHEVMRNTYKIPEGKRPLGRPWGRWEDTKMYLAEIVCKAVE